MRYEPAGAAADVMLGLVGKAITFDTGGISIKPAALHGGDEGRHVRRRGGDRGIGASPTRPAGSRVAVVAAAENMPGGDAFRPGDILRAANGKTIEVVNTDAEGRLVLADALWYAREQGATHVVDLATLTGAMELALGDLYAGVFANDDAWSEHRRRRRGERRPRLAASRCTRATARYVDSTFADMKNSSPLRAGLPALAAEFLREFAGEGPWAHLDMAGPGVPRPLARRLPLRSPAARATACVSSSSSRALRA